MNTQEIANRLVDLCRKGQNALAQVELYDDDIVSIESHLSRYRKTKGISKVQRKTAMFFERAETIHKYEITDPLVVDNHICFKMIVDVDIRGLGRVYLEELCVYHLKDGKIVKEEFFYNTSGMNQE
ncbi:nuclear transport factor 2 family protein [Ochrovirga pacifica]|uniref:nuclear transport factor 2 family protein n=1 Tax=Ochrovirga pacifica TaxID=1042376 RepID=UPI00025583D5|nr:nuclear transport factor 2 family protein [Ochrovirga pacifica]